MRLINSLIFLILSVCCNIIKSQNIANSYVNLVAYNDPQCKETPIFGYGYSTAVDTCVTLDTVNDFIFSVKKNQVSWSSYVNNGGSDESCSGTSESTTIFNVNSCVSSTSIVFNSANKMATGESFYYKISTSSIPYAPSGTYTISYMGGICQNDNIVALQYYVNNTVLVSQENLKFSRFCQDGTPYDHVCYKGQPGGECQNQRATFPCLIIPPFYNSSSDSSYSSACAFTCCSGSCSGTGGTSSETSGTGEGWADIVVKNTDKLQNKFGSGSSSGNGGRYYQSTYCFE